MSNGVPAVTCDEALHAARRVVERGKDAAGKLKIGLRDAVTQTYHPALGPFLARCCHIRCCQLTLRVNRASFVSVGFQLAVSQHDLCNRRVHYVTKLLDAH